VATKKNRGPEDKKEEGEEEEEEEELKGKKMQIKE